MARYLGIIIAGAIVAALAVQGCNVSPIPLPLPLNEAGMSDIFGVQNDAGAGNDSLAPLQDAGAADAKATPDAGAGDGATDGATDGAADGITDGNPDGLPGDAEVDIKSPEASVADICGEC